jgi:hypothetical protein
LKKRYAGMVVVLLSVLAFGVANAEIEFGGVLDVGTTVTRVDSVTFTPPDTAFLTPGWGSRAPLDSHDFIGLAAWPETLVLRGTINAIPFQITLVHPDTSVWYHIGSVIGPHLKFYGDYDGVEESRPLVERQQLLSVSPSVVVGQMTVRLQPVGASRPLVEIRDAVGNVVRSIDFTAVADGAASAKWNREDYRGRLVPEGVYFCRYAAADIIAVRKVLVVH